MKQSPTRASLPLVKALVTSSRALDDLRECQSQRARRQGSILPAVNFGRVVRSLALLPDIGSYDIDLRPTVPRSAVRQAARRRAFWRRRSPLDRLEIPAASRRAIPCCGSSSRSVRPIAQWEACHSFGRALATRSGRNRGSVGSAPPRPADAHRGGFGWSLDPAAKAEIDHILRESITDPVDAEFMTPPQRAQAKALQAAQ